LLAGVDQGKMYNRGVGKGSVGEGKEKKMYKEGEKTPQNLLFPLEVHKSLRNLLCHLDGPFCWEKRWTRCEKYKQNTKTNRSARIIEHSLQITMRMNKI